MSNEYPSRGPTVDEVVRSFIGRRTCAEITKGELEQHGLFRFHDTTRDTYQLLFSGELAALDERINTIMQRDAGYIGLKHLLEMQRHRERREPMKPSALDEIEARAASFRRANIPPVFQPYMQRELQRPDGNEISNFPYIDFILQFGAGTYEKKLAQQAAIKKEKKSKDPMNILLADPDDVRTFRAEAFMPDGNIHPLLKREMSHHIRTAFSLKNPDAMAFVTKRNQQTFDYLEEILADMQVKKNEPRLWDGDPTVAAERRWYLHYDAETVPKIAKAYLEAYKRNPDKRWANAVRRARVLFPELNEETNAKKQAELLREALDTKDFSALPIAALKDPEAWNAIQEAFQNACDALAPEVLLQQTEKIAPLMNFPKMLIAHSDHPHSLHGILMQKRFEALDRMSDEEFGKHFMNSASAKKRFGSLCQTQIGDPQYIAFRQALSERRAKIQKERDAEAEKAALPEEPAQ